MKSTILNFPGGTKAVHDSDGNRPKRLTVGELSEDEKKLLEMYRRATPEVRATMQRLALRMLQIGNRLK